MLAERDIDPDEIESVEVRMGRAQVRVLVFDRPQNRWEAEFSGQYGVAAAVLLGKMGVAELDDEVVLRPEMQAFYSKVTLVPVDEYDERDPVFSPSESVTIRLRSGEELKSGPITSLPGHAGQPLTTEQLWSKFSECTTKTHTDAEARELFDLLQKIDVLSSVRVLPTCNSIFLK
jgi:2-methylcitrate dehydratase PrpD